jgi:hypothetical protein
MADANGVRVQLASSPPYILYHAHTGARLVFQQGNFGEMAKPKENKHKNGNLSLKPLKFEEAVKAILKVKPRAKNQCFPENKRGGTVKW